MIIRYKINQQNISQCWIVFFSFNSFVFVSFQTQSIRFNIRSSFAARLIAALAAQFSERNKRRQRNVLYSPPRPPSPAPIKTIATTTFRIADKSLLSLFSFI